MNTKFQGLERGAAEECCRSSLVSSITTYHDHVMLCHVMSYHDKYDGV